MKDHDLLGFLDDTRRHLDRELANSGAAPDLAASVARAHEIDPEAVPARAVTETAELAPIGQLRPRTRRTTPVPENMSDQAALIPFTAALRTHLDADLARHIHHTAITNPTLAPSGTTGTTGSPAPIDLTSRRRRTTIITAVVALAAAVLLTLGLRGAFEAQPEHPGAAPGAAALASQPGPPDGGQAVPRTSAAHGSTVPEHSSLPPVPEDSPPQHVPGDSSLAPAPADSTTSEPAPKDSPDNPRPRPKRPPRTPDLTPEPAPTEDPLAALDREAQALWQAGKLRSAADKFTEIVQRAPGSRAAETAYGDLFALEHQLGGDPVSLWRAYLRQFPRGRYADDASAGVCLREAAARRDACWRDYLASHPDGAHRREAEQATTTSP